MFELFVVATVIFVISIQDKPVMGDRGGLDVTETDDDHLFI